MRASVSGARRSWAILSPTLFQLVEQALDLVEHQIDGMGDAVDLVAVGGSRAGGPARWPSMMRAIASCNGRAGARRAPREKGADREDRDDGRGEREREGAQQRALDLVDVLHIAPEQRHAAVGAPPRHEDGRLRRRAEALHLSGGEQMRAPVDRNRRHARRGCRATARRAHRTARDSRCGGCRASGAPQARRAAAPPARRRCAGASSARMTLMRLIRRAPPRNR